jgi:hypothetical protein
MPITVTSTLETMKLASQSLWIMVLGLRLSGDLWVIAQVARWGAVHVLVVLVGDGDLLTSISHT